MPALRGKNPRCRFQQRGAQPPNEIPCALRLRDALVAAELRGADAQVELAVQVFDGAVDGVVRGAVAFLQQREVALDVSASSSRSGAIQGLCDHRSSNGVRTSVRNWPG